MVERKAQIRSNNVSLNPFCVEAMSAPMRAISSEGVPLLTRQGRYLLTSLVISTNGRGLYWTCNPLASI